jgi:superfamily II DNA or RNA helicase
MRVRIDGWAWLEKAAMRPEQIDYVKNQLTLIPSSYNDDLPEPVCVYRETEEWLGVPRQYYLENAQRSEVEVEWAVSDGDTETYPGPVKFKGLLRPVQDVCLEHVAKAFAEPNSLGGFLVSPTGSGKTVMSCAVIAHVGKPALVLVHNEALRDQWLASFAKFLPTAKVGIVQGDRVEYEGCHVILAMVQTLHSKRENLPQTFWRYPGLVIADESHRYAAKTLSSVLGRFPARYKLGVTATLRRKDGLDDIFFWHIGRVLYSATVSQVRPSVTMLRTGFEMPMSRSDKAKGSY